MLYNLRLAVSWQAVRWIRLVISWKWLVKVGPTYAPLPNVFQRLAKVVANASCYGGQLNSSIDTIDNYLHSERVAGTILGNGNINIIHNNYHYLQINANVDYKLYFCLITKYYVNQGKTLELKRSSD